jgi:PAP2 superfamily
MRTNWKTLGSGLAGAAALVAVAGCGGGGSQSAVAVEEQAKKVVVIPPLQSNVVANWNQIANTTITAAGLPAVTDEERRPAGAIDLATVQVAVYDAVMAIVRTHKPYAATARTAGAGASQEAAVASAAYNVLKALFPNRSVHYQAQYTSYIASLPAGDARDRGEAIGGEIATQIVALRAKDGRWTEVTYATGTLPGEFRGLAPVVGQTNPFIRPFAMVSADQFRADGPPPLSSSQYAEDFNEVREIGGAVSAKRTAEQLEIARFHTESPAQFPPRNYRAFASTTQSIADNARVMAMIWTAQADGGIACFDSKYHFFFWRPQSAISFALTDGNAATEPDATWTPVVPTPNHPEYPSAHACVNGATAEALNAFYGTKNVSYSFNSTVTGTTRHYATTDEMMDEMQVARVYGGMHFRTATVHGRVLGMKVGKWIAKHHFTPVD